MVCFHCNATENVIFSLNHAQRKVDLNTSKTSLVFVTIRQKISSLRPAIINENFIFADITIIMNNLYTRVSIQLKNIHIY